MISLVEDGTLELTTTARSLLGDDLPLISDDVTVEHLLAHRSGIGDYLDEDAGGEITDYVMPVPVHALATAEDFVAVLDGHPAKFPAGRASRTATGAMSSSRSSPSVRAARRITSWSSSASASRRRCGTLPFLRSDELPRRAALGYLYADGPRTSVLHLAVCGVGDGGIYSTTEDVRALWTALFGGRIVSPAWVADVTRARSDAPEHLRYGLGFWLHETKETVILEGYDAGVSFRSLHDPRSGTTLTVVSNSSNGAWPVARFLQERFAE